MTAYVSEVALVPKLKGVVIDKLFTHSSLRTFSVCYRENTHMEHTLVVKVERKPSAGRQIIYLNVDNVSKYDKICKSCTRK